MLHRLLIPLSLLCVTALLLPACDSESGDETAADGDGGNADTGGNDGSAQLGGACDVVPEATGAEVGDVLADFTMTDSSGNEISLYGDLCDKYVLLVKSHFACSACQEEAPFVGATNDMLADQNFVAVTLLAGAEDNPARLDIWAEEFELSHPVLSDPDHTIATEIVWPGQAGRPKLKLLGPGAVVLGDHPIELGDIPALIAE